MTALLRIQCRIAMRNIIRNRRRSLLTISAVAFGIFCLIIFQALKTGMHEKMLQSSLGLDLGSIQIHAAGYEPNMPLLQPLPASAAVRALLAEQHLQNSAPRLKTTALILAGRRSSSVVLAGIIPAQEQKVTFIHQKIIAGHYALGNRRLLMGKSLADTLNLALGDPVNLLVQNSFGQPVTAKMVVGGLFQSGLARFDRSHVYAAIDDLRSMMETEAEAITEVAIAVDPDLAAPVAAAIKAALPAEGFQVLAFTELAPDLVQLMALNNATFKLLIIIVFTIVAMGIANTMTTVIFERYRELGTLAAIGATPAAIVQLIMTESALLGLFSAAVGSLAGLAACLWLGSHGIDLSHFTSSNQYFAAGSVLKASLTMKDLLTANLITLATALLAGLYPAIRAACLKPVEALRHT